MEREKKVKSTACQSVRNNMERDVLAVHNTVTRYWDKAPRTVWRMRLRRLYFWLFGDAADREGKAFSGIIYPVVAGWFRLLGYPFRLCLQRRSIHTSTASSILLRLNAHHFTVNKHYLDYRHETPSIVSYHIVFLPVDAVSNRSVR